MICLCVANAVLLSPISLCSSLRETDFLVAVLRAVDVLALVPVVLAVDPAVQVVALFTHSFQ